MTADGGDERFGLSWRGKSRACRRALSPPDGALVPCPDESVGWDDTRNLVIEGDNLEVLKLLGESLAGGVKLVYIDPPYNTGKGFTFRDDYRGQGHAALDGSETSAGDRLHAGWLDMMCPRLALARTLLRDDGAIFVSIDDTEVANLTVLLSELFGPDNLVGTFIWEKRRSRENRRAFSVNHEYIVCAAKDRPAFEATRGLLPLTDEARSRYANPDSDPRGDWQSVAVTAQAGHGTAAQFYAITTPGGRRVDPPSGNCWRFTRERLEELIADRRIWFGVDGNNVPRQKVFLSERGEGLTPHTIWTAGEVGTTDTAKRDLNALFDGAAVFDTPKPVGLVGRVIEIGGSPDGVVLDFFAGSGPTAEAVMRANAADGGQRRFVLVQLPEPLDPGNRDQRVAAEVCDRIGRPRTIAELTKERLRRAARRIADEDPAFAGDLGFRVFRLVSERRER
jgi:adenine-specific DNA-methyltransferase